MRALRFCTLNVLAAVALMAQPGPDRTIVKITGDGHKLVLYSDGTLGGWGLADSGQLGPRAGIRMVSNQSTAYVPITLPGKAKDIAAGSRTSYVLLDDGSVVSFGWGWSGELGCGNCKLRDDRDSETPVRVSGLSNIASIAASGTGGFAVHRDGSVYAWGIGVGKAPVRVEGVSRVVQVSASSHVLALTSDGHVWSWGTLPVRYENPNRPPAEVPGLTDVVSVVATGVAAVLKKDGTVWVWGNNQQAQFGNGKRDDKDLSETPVRVPGVDNVVELSGAVNGRHFLALRKDGTIRSWGNSDWGQGGVGIKGKEQATPATPKIASVEKVFAAGNNSFAILKDGSLWMWGVGTQYDGAWPFKAPRKNEAFPVQLEIPGGLVAAPVAVPVTAPKAVGTKAKH